MPCLTPVIVKADRKKGSDYATQAFPCGKCPDCLKRRQSGWSFRLQKQQEVSDTSYFITLTYSNENLPASPNDFPTLDKTDLQKFIKRLRKRIADYTKDSEEEYKPVKYYACGEYGTNTRRPHYHAIIFNVPRFFMDNQEMCEHIWGKGQVKVDNCNAATINYVTKYIMKQVKWETRESNDDRDPEFSLMSKGMGANWLTPAVTQYYKAHKLPYIIKEGGEKQSMPRYYREKIYTESERKQIAQKTLEYLYEQFSPFKSAQHEMDWKKIQFYKKDKKAVERQKF